jgi:hypothetical protein
MTAPTRNWRLILKTSGIVLRVKCSGGRKFTTSKSPTSRSFKTLQPIMNANFIVYSNKLREI